jgi:hypothetical protein
MDFVGSMPGFGQHFKVMDSKHMHGKLVMPESLVTSAREDAVLHHEQKRRVSNRGTNVRSYAHERPHEDAQAGDKFLKAALQIGKID